MIFLDVDGVLANFVDGVMEVFGHPSTFRDLPTYDISKHLGRRYDEIWAHPAVASREFWANLKAMPWAQDLVECLQARGDVALLTQPIRSPLCLAGKRDWIHQHFPKLPFFISNKKELVAAPGFVLIDDYDKNVDAWTKRGGHGILFPAPYNELGFHENPIPAVERALK